MNLHLTLNYNTYMCTHADAMSGGIRPLTHRSARITYSALAARRATTATITNMVEQNKEQTRGTEKHKNEATRKMLVRWLIVYIPPRLRIVRGGVAEVRLLSEDAQAVHRVGR